MSESISSQTEWDKLRVEPAAIPRLARADMAISIVLGLLALALAAAWTQTVPASWNDISRVAAMQARVEQGTWALNNSPWLDLTEDKVLLGENYFSGKMPLLSAIGAVEYAVLHNVAGLALAPDCAQTANGCAYYWLTLTLVGIPFALMVGVMYAWARGLNFSIGVALLGTLALGLGTEVFPYALTLNHHVPAAVSLFVGLYALVQLAPRQPRWLLVTGFAATFAPLCDPLAGLFAVGLFVLAVVRYRAQALYFVVGALPPLLATAWLDLQITGTVIPPYMTLSGYAYKEAGDQRGLAGAGTPDDLPQYAFKMFLGAQGLFAYNPILLFALLGVGIVAFHRQARLNLEALVVGLAALGVGLYLAFRTGNLGGNAYGERYLISVVPIVMAFLFFAPPLFKTRGRAVWAILFAVFLGLSVYSSFQGAANPWEYAQPPFHLTRNAETGALGARWNVRLPFR